MKRLNCLVALAIIFTASTSANATVIDFEDTTEKQILYDGYHGFSWNSRGDVAAVDGTNYDTNYATPYPTGYTTLANALPGDKVAFNWAASYPVEIIVADAATFDLNSAWFAPAWYPELTLYFSGWLNGNRNYSKIEEISLADPEKIVFNWTGIDTFMIDYFDDGFRVGDDGAYDVDGVYAPQFAMDNMVVNEPVPEPATMLLFGTGLLVLVGYKRKKKVK